MYFFCIYVFCSKNNIISSTKNIACIIKISEQKTNLYPNNFDCFTCFVIVSTRVCLSVCDDSTRILKSHIISLCSLGQIKKNRKKTFNNKLNPHLPKGDTNHSEWTLLTSDNCSARPHPPSHRRHPHPHHWAVPALGCPTKSPAWHRRSS